MIITVLGNLGDTDKKASIQSKLYNVLWKNIFEENTQIYLGRFGDFCNSALEVCSSIKQSHQNTTICLISPTNYHKLIEDEPYISDFDFQIFINYNKKYYNDDMLARNIWMIKQSDIVIACYNKETPLAKATYTYLLKSKKLKIDIGSYKLDKIEVLV